MPATAPRIVSLLPAATEMVGALGLGKCLVGRSHECDVPEEATRLPSLTRTRIDSTLTSRAIHEAVERQVAENRGASPSIFELDIAALAALRPDIILTQGTCAACAITEDDVAEAVARSGHASRIVSLSAVTLNGLWTDILAVGEATGVLPRAREVVAALQARCDSVACRVAALGRKGAKRPKVAVIEWLDPLMAAGNWVPELVRLAGGTDVLGREASHSHWIDWPVVASADPDVVILAPCGFTLEQTLREAAAVDTRRELNMLRAVREGRLWSIDGHHLLNRPGPRLVDSLEVLAAVLHPGSFDFPATRRFARPMPHGGKPNLA